MTRSIRAHRARSGPVNQSLPSRVHDVVGGDRRATALPGEQGNLAAMVAAVQRDVAEDVGDRVPERLAGAGPVFDLTRERLRVCRRDGAQPGETLPRKS